MEVKNGNNGKIIFTEKQKADVKEFTRLIKDGNLEKATAFTGTISEGVEFLKSQKNQDLKAAVHTKEAVDKKVTCLGCDAELKIPQDSSTGEITTCQDCGDSFEITKTSDGVNIKPAEKVGEDWGE